MAYSDPGQDGQYTKTLAAWCASTEFADVPPMVAQRATHVLLDGFGCAVFGANKPWSRILMDTVSPASQAGAARLWGTSRSAAPDHAALINGACTQGYELDDWSREGAFHGCAVILPAAMSAAATAAARGRKTSGRTLLTAAITGFEVGNRVGKCLGSSLILERGWHSGSVIGTPAAAVAAGRVLGLDAAGLENAFGIAATQACGLMSAQFGSMVKRMNHGRAAQSGYYAGTLAAAGYTGIEDVFELPYGGFCGTFTASRDEFRLEELTGQLGERYDLLSTCIKPYSCNASIHVSLDAILSIRRRRPFQAADVASVEVRCTLSTLEHIGWRYQGTGAPVEAQMNMSYGIAVMILEGDAFIHQYREEMLTSPQVLSLTKKITVVHEPRFDQLGSSRRHHIQLTVHFTDGTAVSEELDDARGSAALPASEEDITAKFGKLASQSLDADHAARLKNLILGLEEVEDVAELADALGVPGDR